MKPILFGMILLALFLSPDLYRLFFSTHPPMTPELRLERANDNWQVLYFVRDLVKGCKEDDLLKCINPDEILFIDVCFVGNEYFQKDLSGDLSHCLNGSFFLEHSRGYTGVVINKDSGKVRLNVPVKWGDFNKDPQYTTREIFYSSGNLPEYERGQFLKDLQVAFGGEVYPVRW